MAEAVRDIDRAYLRKATELALHSDARKRAFVVYFNGCDKSYNALQGMLGFARDVGGTSQGIHNAVIAITEQACTARAFPPYRESGSGDPGKLDLKALENIRRSMLIFDGDAASNEQLAGRMLQGKSAIKEVFQAHFPNMLAVVKDPTHASTRLTKPTGRLIPTCTKHSRRSSPANTA